MNAIQLATVKTTLLTVLLCLCFKMNHIVHPIKTSVRNASSSVKNKPDKSARNSTESSENGKHKVCYLFDKYLPIFIKHVHIFIKHIHISMKYFHIYIKNVQILILLNCGYLGFLIPLDNWYKLETSFILYTLFKVQISLLYLFTFIQIIVQHATTKIVPALSHVQSAVIESENLAFLGWKTRRRECPDWKAI